MTTLLTVINDVCGVLKIPRTDTVVSSSDQTYSHLLALAHKEVTEIVNLYEWAELQKTHTITLQNGVTEYALPSDFLKLLPSTEWNRAEQWRLYGPLTPQEWQSRESGLLDVIVRTEYRIKNNKIHIRPTPTASTAGNILAFEYQCSQCIRPKNWVTNTSFSPGSYCYSNDKVYYTTAGGTTGATAPSHSSGTVTDGTVLWTYSSDPYTRFTADTDVFVLNPYYFTLGIEWRWKAENGFDYSESKKKYMDYMSATAANNKGAQMFYFGSGVQRINYTDLVNIPDTGYGS